MSRKQKKKDAREQSTRQLMGIDDITDYGIATRMGELVFFAIKPTNISVLPDAGVGARIYALLNVVKGMAEIEMLALNSKESFENNKAFYRQRANEEELPVIRKLLEQDSKHLDRIQVLMASSREFYILVRLQGKKESDVFSYLSRIEKSIKDSVCVAKKEVSRHGGKASDRRHNGAGRAAPRHQDRSGGEAAEYAAAGSGLVFADTVILPPLIMDRDLPSLSPPDGYLRTEIGSLLPAMTHHRAGVQAPDPLRCLLDLCRTDSQLPGKSAHLSRRQQLQALPNDPLRHRLRFGQPP